MAESLSAEQIEERRTNLRAFRHVLGMVDASELTTTLLIQEGWLATVDELQTHVQDAYLLRGLRTRKCLRGTGGLALVCEDCYGDIAEYCAPCYLRRLRAVYEAKVEMPLPVPKILPLSEFKDVSEYQGGIPKVQEWTEEECETTGQAHVWVKVGTVGLGDHGLSAMDWGDTKCLRCGIPVSVPDFDYEAE